MLIYFPLLPLIIKAFTPIIPPITPSSKSRPIGTAIRDKGCTNENVSGAFVKKKAKTIERDKEIKAEIECFHASF